MPSCQVLGTGNGCSPGSEPGGAPLLGDKPIKIHLMRHNFSDPSPAQMDNHRAES